MASHVLVPIDDSDRSADALEYALEMYPDATITALHVITMNQYYPTTGIEGGVTINYEQLRKNADRRADQLLEEVRETAASAGVDIETDSVVGDISTTIVEYTEEHDVDHIVIGSHGRSGASRILLGSVAESVARRSPVPVTIVR